MSALELDPRVARGTEAMLAQRSERLANGERPLGWKLGFGSTAARERLGTDRPLVGFLTAATALDDGARVPVGSWSAPVFEAEIAVHLARDIGPDASREVVRSAIGGLGPAIELADLGGAPMEPEAVLATNIFHRHVLLGPVDGGRSDAQGVTARLLRDGEEVASTTAPEELTGELAEVLRLAAELLGAAGERMRAGEVVICGSVVPPLAVAAGQRLSAELHPLGTLAVELV